jgi:hypothetical protein
MYYTCCALDQFYAGGDHVACIHDGKPVEFLAIFFILEGERDIGLLLEKAVGL